MSEGEGRKLDDGKERYDLLPFAALREVVRALGYGAGKYGDENWRKVERARRRYLAACFRHIIAWQQGETNDPESGLHHLAHACCCCLFMLAFELNDEPR